MSISMLHSTIVPYYVGSNYLGMFHPLFKLRLAFHCGKFRVFVAIPINSYRLFQICHCISFAPIQLISNFKIYFKYQMFFFYFLLTFLFEGLLVEGYIVRNGTWMLIGSQLSKDQPRVITKITELINYGQYTVYNVNITTNYRKVGINCKGPELVLESGR